MFFDPLYLIVAAPAMILAFWAQMRVRSAYAQGMQEPAVCTGAHILAEAGLLDGYKCTIHWENLAAFLEEFPELDVSNELFEIDRKRYTCAGGTTSIDLLLEIVRTDFGQNLANEVANQFQYERIRSAGDRQRVGPERDLTGKSEKLKKIVELMADNLDEPFSAVDRPTRRSLADTLLELKANRRLPILLVTVEAGRA